MVKNIIIAGLSCLCIVLVTHALRMEMEWTKLVSYYGYAEKFIEEAENDWRREAKPSYCISFYLSDAGLDYVHASEEIKQMLKNK